VRAISIVLLQTLMHCYSAIVRSQQMRVVARQPTHACVHDTMHAEAFLNRLVALSMQDKQLVPRGRDYHIFHEY